MKRRWQEPRVIAADTSSYCTEGSRHAQLQHKGSAADMPSYGNDDGLPIRPVTVQAEGCQYAQLR
jgi:hypothetical protein